MKMRNKILGILITLVIMIGVMASQVNAANISASSTEINKGDTVVVTVNLDNETPYIDIDLSYDANSFEYVDKSATSDLPSLTVNNKADEGLVLVSAADATETTKYISFTFTAKEATDAAEFVASGLNTITDEELNVSSVSVAVVEKTEEPTTPEQPEQPENPGDVETPNTDTPSDTTVSGDNGSETNTGSQKVDENGNVITKLPQTGTSIVTVAGVVAAVVVVAVIAVRKLRK